MTAKSQLFIVRDSETMSRSLWLALDPRLGYDVAGMKWKYSNAFRLEKEMFPEIESCSMPVPAHFVQIDEAEIDDNTLWMGRNDDGTLCLSWKKPERNSVNPWWSARDKLNWTDDALFPELTWEAEPIPVKLYTMKSTKVFVDMDGVLVNFQSGIDKLDEATKLEYANDGKGKAHYDDVPGIFSQMDPLDGALDGVRALQAMGYDLYILSTAPWGNPSAWADKVEWVTRHLDDVFHKRMIITHGKGLLAAQEDAYLIDDRTGHGASKFGERHLQFGAERFRDWASVVKFFEKLAE